MPLTEDESKFVQKWLRGMEKFADSWAWTRWILVAMSVFLLAMAGIYASLAGRFSPENSALAHLSIYAAPDQMVAALKDARNENHFYLFFQMHLVAGIAILMVVLLRWNRGRRNKLLARLLREYLHDKHGMPLPEQGN